MCVTCNYESSNTVDTGVCSQHADAVVVGSSVMFDTDEGIIHVDFVFIFHSYTCVLRV